MLGLKLLVTDAKFFSSVTHQYAQFTNTQVAHFMHANQQ